MKNTMSYSFVSQKDGTRLLTIRLREFEAGAVGVPIDAVLDVDDFGDILAVEIPSPRYFAERAGLVLREQGREARSMRFSYDEDSDDMYLELTDAKGESSRNVPTEATLFIDQLGRLARIEVVCPH